MAESPTAALQALRGPDYAVKYCGALVLADFLTRHGQVHSWCPGVEDEVLEMLGMRPTTSPSAGLAAALEGLEAGARVLFVPRPQRLLFRDPI